LDTKKIYNILSLRSNHKLIKKWILDNVVYYNDLRVDNVSIRHWKQSISYVTIHIDCGGTRFRFGTFRESIEFPIQYYIPITFMAYMEDFYRFLLILERKNKISDLTKVK
jgi:hypothetical protein